MVCLDRNKSTASAMKMIAVTAIVEYIIHRGYDLMRNRYTADKIMVRIAIRNTIVSICFEWRLRSVYIALTVLALPPMST
jgi:hypothetical protein